MFEVTSNLQQVMNELNALPEAFDDALELGCDVAAVHVLQVKDKKVGRTYARPIPLRKRSRKPRWTRSGDFRRNQGIESPDRFTRIIAVTGKPSEPIRNYPGGYEQKLATLPRSRDGVDRKNNAAEETFEAVAPQIPALIEQEIRNFLG